MTIKLFGFEIIVRKIVPVTPQVIVPVVPKKKKVYRKKCLYREKVMYTREDAVEAMKKIQNPQIRIYCCEFCQHWHLTHKKFIRNKHD